MSCYIIVDMSSLNARAIPALISELEGKYFWWEPVGTGPRSHARILAHAMNLASFEDVRRLEKVIGPDLLAEIMLEAEPGWLNERSWEFWRGRLELVTRRSIPVSPPRRSLDAG